MLRTHTAATVEDDLLQESTSTIMVHHVKIDEIQNFIQLQGSQMNFYYSILSLKDQFNVLILMYSILRVKS